MGLTALLAELQYPCWDPLLTHVRGVALRWYGLMYVLGFLAALLILRRLVRAGFVPMTVADVLDLLTWLIAGVFVGGRLGFVLFYRILPGDSVSDALGSLLTVGDGGFSFHGGLIGVVLTSIAFTRRRGLPTLRVGDGLALAATPGIFAVRLANFIDGELLGRITTLPWGMRFPTDRVALRLLEIPAEVGPRLRERLILERVADGTWDRVRDQVPLRHPSQLYEAAGEGLLLGLVLWAVYRATRQRPLASGVYLGLLLVGYGAVRVVLERFRQPDAHLAPLPLGLTLGQLLSGVMVAAGLLLIQRRWRLREAAA